jgi:hypothetical protein
MSKYRKSVITLKGQLYFSLGRGRHKEKNEKLHRGVRDVFKEDIRAKIGEIARWVHYDTGRPACARNAVMGSIAQSLCRARRCLWVGVT